MMYASLFLYPENIRDAISGSVRDRWFSDSGTTGKKNDM